MSFGSGEIGDTGLLAAILRDQLQVTEEEFWRVVREGGPARRAEMSVAAAPLKPPVLDATTVLQLRKLGLALEEIRALGSQTDAEELLRRLRELRATERHR